MAIRIIELNPESLYLVPPTADAHPGVAVLLTEMPADVRTAWDQATTWLREKQDEELATAAGLAETLAHRTKLAREQRDPKMLDAAIAEAAKARDALQAAVDQPSNAEAEPVK